MPEDKKEDEKVDKKDEKLDETLEDENEEEEEKQEEEKEKFVFESEEDFVKKTSTIFDSVLEKRRQAREEEKAKRQADKQLAEDSKEPERIFPKNYQAKDWEEAGSRILSAWEKKQAARQNKAKMEVDNINKRYDDELVNIRNQNPKLPAKGTEEGMTWEKEIAKTALKYGSTTMTGAYEAWKDTGGDKAISKKQKNLASKIGTTSSARPTQSVRKYEDVSSTDLDSAEERAVEAFKKLS